MPWLQFSSRDGLRIALAAGAIPLETASCATRIAIDQTAIEIEFDTLPYLDAIKRLGGKILQQPTHATIIQVVHWFAIIPLEASTREYAVKECLIADDANVLARRLPELANLIDRWALVEGRLMVVCRTIPLTKLPIYRPVHGHWIRLGYEHRLEAILPPGDDVVLDCEWQCRVTTWHPWPVQLHWPRVECHDQPSPLDSISIRLKPANEWSDWKGLALSREGYNSPSSFVRIDHLQEWGEYIATLRNPERVQVVWLTDGTRTFGIAKLESSTIPIGTPLKTLRHLCPALRQDIIDRFESDETLFWLETDQSHRLLKPQWQSPSITWAIPEKETLRSVRAESFSFDEFTTFQPIPPQIDVEIAEDKRPPSPPARSSKPSLIARLLEKFRRAKPEPEVDDEPMPVVDVSTLPPITERQPLPLELEIFDHYRDWPPAIRGTKWATLAQTYAQRQAYAEATLCWLNAVWESDPSTVTPRLEAWLKCERDDDRKQVILALLGRASPPLPRDGWPIRLNWLTVLARRDELALARWHDHTLKTLHSGLAPDRDAPAFLRFIHHSEEFPAIRTWVFHNHETAKRWLEHALRGRGRLQAVGLDPNPQTTLAYADGLFASVATRLGERVIAEAWQHNARQVLFKELDTLTPLHRATLHRWGWEASFDAKALTPLETHTLALFDSRIHGLPTSTSLDRDSLVNFINDFEPHHHVTTIFPIVNTLREMPDLAMALARKCSSKPAMAADAKVASAAAAWLVAGQTDRGLTLLDACRDQLYSPHKLAARDQTELAIATANALGFAPARIARGRLEEYFQRLTGLDLVSSTNRYFCWQPLAVIAAAIESAVPKSFELDANVRDWLAEDERIVRMRMANDCHKKT